LATHDLVVDSSCFFARPDFADETSIPVPDCELGYRSRFGNRKQVRAFESGVRVIAKDLFDVCRRDLGADLRVDLDRFDGERAWERNRKRVRTAAAWTGTMTPWALAAVASVQRIEKVNKSRVIVWVRIEGSPKK
jgi:hypothetical protein